MLFTFSIEDFNLNKFEKIAIDYLNKNKNAFLQEYTANINPIDEKIAIFTAGNFAIIAFALARASSCFSCVLI